jgi:hypothetical protein
MAMSLLRLQYAVLAMCIGLAASLVGASPASAASAYSYRTQSSNGSLCMDVSYASTDNGAGIKQWPCDGGPAQKWTLRYEQSFGGIAYYQLVSALSPAGNPKCLDLPWGNPAAGQTLQLWDCLGAARQLWSYEQVPGLTLYALRNLQTGQCVDVPWGVPTAGVALWQWPCNGTVAQQWYRTLG